MTTILSVAGFGALVLPALASVVACYVFRDGITLKVDATISVLLTAIVWGGPLALAGYLFTLAAGL